jgi:hypothetical protein
VAYFFLKVCALHIIAGVIDFYLAELIADSEHWRKLLVEVGILEIFIERLESIICGIHHRTDKDL